MKKINSLIFSLIAIAACLFSGCSSDESTLSKAVLASANELSFAANNASEKIITVYADADWVAEVPDWVTVSPAEGTGTMDVTISVSDNMRGGSMDNPRKATLVFRGGTLASRAEVTVSQEGDKYRDCPTYKLSELAALNNEAVVAVSEAIVSAVTTKGFIATDATNSANVFMQTTASVKVGDKVSVKGSKGTDSSLTLVSCDETKVLSSGNTVTYPQATDITATVDTYTSDSRSFIAATGLLSGNKITITDATNQVLISDAPESLNLSALNGHSVTVKGYYAGTAAPVVKVMATEVEDKGVAELVYFSDDFEWLSTWATASGAGQTVENDDAGANAPNVFTTETLGTEFLKDVEETHGYTFVYRNASDNKADAVYIQSNYLKFGKTSFEAGIVLPAIDGIPAGEKLTLSFDWCPMITGTHKYDATELAVLITNNGTDTELATFSHGLANSDKMRWLHAEVNIEGINITKDTKITIRSKDWSATAKAQRRWFLDNIKLKKNDQ